MHAWLDISAGVAGDMLLGALLDAGADAAAVRSAIEAVAPASVRLEVEPVVRGGQRATKARVGVLVDDPPHRTWASIRETLGSAALDERVRALALAAFGRLADAEGRVHGVDPDTVHFHEVGALDSIADVVGTCAALVSLGVSSVSASPVRLGSGRVRAAHGDIPVPVPAVAELAVGWEVYPAPSGGMDGGHHRARDGGHHQARDGGHHQAGDGGHHQAGDAAGGGSEGRHASSCHSRAEVPVSSGTNSRVAADPDPGTDDHVGINPGQQADHDHGADHDHEVDHHHHEDAHHHDGVRHDHGHSHDTPAALTTPDGVGELATPTGLVLVRTLASVCEPLPGMTVAAVGVGAGSKDFAGWPNVVRVVLGEQASAPDRPATELTELMANVDDMDPRLWPDVLDALLAAGAADAWLVPIHMKKGRPAFTVHALANPAAHDAVVDALLARTTTLGVREMPVTRTVLDRSWRAVAVDGVHVQVKVGSRGGVIWQATPEFDSLVAAADALGVPLRTLATRVAAAQAEAGLVAGHPHR